MRQHKSNRQKLQIGSYLKESTVDGQLEASFFYIYRVDLTACESFNSCYQRNQEYIGRSENRPPNQIFFVPGKGGLYRNEYQKPRSERI